MKTRHTMNTPLSVVAMAVALLLSMPVVADIAGSLHDFSGQAWNTTGEICVVCHAPHAASNSASGPLWNHAVTSATYTLYSGGDPNGGTDLEATSVMAQPVGVSKLCLSCHDGSIAVDSFGGATGTVTIAAARNIGEVTAGTGDLSNDHPVSFPYPATDAEIVASAAGAVGGVLPLFGATETLECATCHDVHNTGIAVGQPFLLRVSNSTNDGGAASGLCLTCHSK